VRRVAKRTKIYDRKCPGLFVSTTTSGVSTFYYKATNPGTGKQFTGWLGVFNVETFNVEHARTKVYALRGNGAVAIVETMRQQKVQQNKRGRPVNQLIEERIEWMKEDEQKEDGEMRPRIETWKNVASHLRRFLGKALGHKLATEITKNDIAALSNDILDGKYGKKSVANARHMRRATSALFNWAAEAGRDYVPASPYVNLPAQERAPAQTRPLG
jgi:hypothetical protein